METYDDDLLTPIPDQPPTPPPQSKLKRLKKSAPEPPPSIVPVLDPTHSSSLPVFDSNTEPNVGSPGPVSVGLGEEASPDADLDPLFSAPLLGSESLDLDWEREAEKVDMLDFDRGGEDEDIENGRKIDGPGKEKSAKKRLRLEDEEVPKTKKRSRKLAGPDGKPKESAREKKRLEKERKAHLEHIHAESQRLLRETRDASFKPVPLVQKPISSVLEKIRLRKLEMLKKYSILHESDSVLDLDSPAAAISLKADLTETRSDVKDDDGARMVDDINAGDAGSGGTLPDPFEAIPPIKEDCNDSQLSVRDDYPPDDNTSEDISVPSLSASNSRLDPADVSSSEDEDDKENVDPHPCRDVDMDLYPKGGPAKVFVDDEAEEEDDSDHDLMRFQENEEDECDEDEELNDLIATGFEEAPVDHEKRNQLHQKWLEQQDTAATDNVLQKLKCGKNKREPTFTFEEDDQEFDEGSEEEALHDLPTSNVVQKNSKKAKQMIIEMFNDENDVYVPSDDEETEQTLIRQRFLKQTNETSFVSPLDDGNSREVFGLIKKLNIAPESKKRGKATTSSFDMLMMGGNSNSSSKSSFLGRATSNSLSSSHKQGPNTVRGFIFSRDDSNSRSGISASENVPDTSHKENQPAKAAPVKMMGSQFKPPASKANNESDMGSGPSLFQILRQSSMQFDERLENKACTITETQVAYQFSAFKVGKRFSNVESRI